MRNRKLNSSADVDRYLNIKSMDGDDTKYAYSLEITNENSRSIYAESDVYGWTYKIDKKTTAVWLDGKKIANSCTYSIDEYFDVERPVNSSKKLNSSSDYTWEIQADDFRFGTQRGYLTQADIEAFIQELMDMYGCTVTHPNEHTWYLTDLSFTDYEELERVYWREVGYYISAKAENAKKPVNSSKRSKKLNSSLDTMDAIDAIREYKETIEDTIPGIKEELDWLSIEIQDYVDGELDDSYAEHVKACVEKLQEVMNELHKLHTDVHVFINELD